MRLKWYGDRRDRVKRGGLLHLAEKFGLSTIVQVAYLPREGDWEDRMITVGAERREVANEVWDLFL